MRVRVGRRIIEISDEQLIETELKAMERLDAEIDRALKQLCRSKP
jgi:hypothetical protein